MTSCPEQRLLQQIQDRRITMLIEGLSAAAIQFARLYETRTGKSAEASCGCWEIFSSVSQITARNARHINKLLELSSASLEQANTSSQHGQRVAKLLGEMILEVCRLADLLPHLVAICRIEELPKNPALGPLAPEIAQEYYRAASEAELLSFSRHLKLEFVTLKNLLSEEHLELPGALAAQLDDLEETR